MKIRSIALSGLIFAASLAAGYGGVYLTAYVFDHMNWCCYHSWALLHGGFVVVFLFWAYIGFHVVNPLLKVRDQLAPIPNLAFVFSAVGTAYETEFMMWPGLAVCAYGIFRRFRHGERETQGLLWAAVVVSLLNFAYWLYLKILFLSYMRDMG